MSLNVLPILSSKSFIVYAPTFRSLIHFEFIFVYGVWKCSLFLTKEARIYNGAKIASLISGAGKTGQHM